MWQLYRSAKMPASREGMLAWRRYVMAHNSTRYRAAAQLLRKLMCKYQTYPLVCTHANRERYFVYITVP